MKGIVANGGHRVGNGYRCKANAVAKGLNSNTDDGIHCAVVIHTVGNNHIACNIIRMVIVVGDIDYTNLMVVTVSNRVVQRFPLIGVAEVVSPNGLEHR